MQAPSAAQLVGMWERGARQPWVDRALTLVSACHPELTDSELRALTVGERDADLLALRERLFGRALKSFAECPHCRARLEFSVDVNDLRDSFASFSNAEQVTIGAPAELTVENIRVRFRRLSSEDLQAAARCADVAEARRVLLQRCVVDARRNGEALAVADLPPACVEALSSRLAALDGAADIGLDLRCVACHHAWQLTLDIVKFLWAEVNALAKGYLNDVHTLAWAYGWREADILAMSTARRQFYLERVG
jgi:hypothetical protein